MSPIQPITGQRYGWALYTSVPSSSSISPGISLSTRTRRSSFTTSRSEASVLSEIVSERIRSLSRSSTFSSASDAKSS